MDSWIGFWKVVLILCLSLYFILAAIISVGGFKDAKSFLKDLKDGNKD